MALPPQDHAALAEALLPAVLEAGRIEMRHFREGVAVERKADASPVTAADREAEAVLLAALAAAAPAVPVIAEEQAAAGLSPAEAPAFFLVDPLDGTREFVRQCPEFTINIGLIRHRAPVFGLIYAPALGEFYVTLAPDRAVGGHVPLDSAARLADLALAPLRTREPDLKALVALESRSHRTAATESFLARFSLSDVARAGSSLKFCLIARGDADFYPRLGPTNEWDTAAGHAILAAAGGAVTTLEGAEFVYGKAAASYLNPSFVAWGRPSLARELVGASSL